MTKTQSNDNKEQTIREALSYLLEGPLLDEIIHVSNLREVMPDEVILNVGDKMQMIPIVLKGSIKVSRENDQGDELLLYYIEGGDTCAMTLQCCVKDTASEIKATAMEKSLLLMIPVEMMQNWMQKYRSWQEYILQSYHARMLELMETIDEIAFKRLDERLLKYLVDQAKLLGSLEIHLTHQKIAEDLNSSRVVISRLLKQLEIKKKIKLHRNKIILNTI